MIRPLRRAHGVLVPLVAATALLLAALAFARRPTLDLGRELDGVLGESQASAIDSDRWAPLFEAPHIDAQRVDAGLALRPGEPVLIADPRVVFVDRDGTVHRLGSLKGDRTRVFAWSGSSEASGELQLLRGVDAQVVARAAWSWGE